MLSSVLEPKREDRPGRDDEYFLTMDETHFEETFRAQRCGLIAISRRLDFPVDARGNVTDGDGHSATPLQACLINNSPLPTPRRNAARVVLPRGGCGYEMAA